jgi:hypothetical protein
MAGVFKMMLKGPGALGENIRAARNQGITERDAILQALAAERQNAGIDGGAAGSAMGRLAPTAVAPVEAAQDTAIPYQPDQPEQALPPAEPVAPFQPEQITLPGTFRNIRMRSKKRRPFGLRPPFGVKG